MTGKREVFGCMVACKIMAFSEVFSSFDTKYKIVANFRIKKDFQSVMILVKQMSEGHEQSEGVLPNLYFDDTISTISNFFLKCHWYEKDNN